MRNNKIGSTTTVNVVCAIIFVIFTVYYFCSFQGDILGMIQYSWSNHETHYDRMTGGVILTSIACSISVLVSMFTSLPRRLYAIIYMPALLLMSLLTAVKVDDNGSVTMYQNSAIILAALLFLFPFIARTSSGYKPFASSLRSMGFLSQVWVTNLFVMLAMILMVYGFANTDRSLHTRLAVERLCHDGDYDKALEVGIPSHDHGVGLTMWRAYAMSRQNMSDIPNATLLGEKLFEYNIDSSCVTLLPRGKGEPHALLKDCYPIWQSLGFVPRNVNESPELYLERELRRGTASKAAHDYLLCDYLLRRDIRGFVSQLPKYYDVKKNLPKHYAEALTIYKSSNIREITIHRDSLSLSPSIQADYEDFVSLMRQRKPAQQKKAELRDAFFGTYWYYYYSE